MLFAFAMSISIMLELGLVVGDKHLDVVDLLGGAACSPDQGGVVRARQDLLRLRLIGDDVEGQRRLDVLGHVDCPCRQRRSLGRAGADGLPGADPYERPQQDGCA